MLRKAIIYSVYTIIQKFLDIAIVFNSLFLKNFFVATNILIFKIKLEYQ